eukprot:SM004713S16678  [mRNA]  locus=s4713:736:942:+ [translate_table: standard]
MYEQLSDEVLSMTNPVPESATDVEKLAGPQLVDPVAEVFRRFAKQFPEDTLQHKRDLLRFQREPNENIT